MSCTGIAVLVPTIVFFICLLKVPFNVYGFSLNVLGAIFALYVFSLAVAICFVIREVEVEKR
mgnify:CR=1 FL=1